MHHYSKLGENALRKGSRHLRTTLSYQIIPNQNKQNIYTPAAVKNEDSSFDDDPWEAGVRLPLQSFEESDKITALIFASLFKIWREHFEKMVEAF